jgi:hypothetical protein
MNYKDFIYYPTKTNGRWRVKYPSGWVGFIVASTEDELKKKIDELIGMFVME